jgi:type III restriction enzyme
MLQRAMPELMGMKNIVVINDESHHCYRERVKDATGETEDDLKGEEKDEAKENNEAARMWISGLETVKRKLGIALVYDLSATPFSGIRVRDVLVRTGCEPLSFET